MKFDMGAVNPIIFLEFDNNNSYSNIVNSYSKYSNGYSNIENSTLFIYLYYLPVQCHVPQLVIYYNKPIWNYNKISYINSTLFKCIGFPGNISIYN